MHALEQVQSVFRLILLKNKSFKVGIRFIKSTETILPGIEKSWSGKGVTKVLKPHSFSQIESVDYAFVIWRHTPNLMNQDAHEYFMQN